MAEAAQITRMQLETRKWFNEPKNQAHTILHALMRFMDNRQSEYRRLNWIHHRLFDNDAALRMVGRMAAQRRNEYRLTLNVVRACVTTVHSKITQTKPRPTYLTLGQGQRARQKAKNTQGYSDALIYHTEGYDVGSKWVMDACIFGTGAIDTMEGMDGLPISENVPLHEIHVEHFDGRNRNPRNVYRWYRVDRDDLLEMYPKFKAQIKAAPRAPREHQLYTEELADPVMVCKAVRRPLAKDAPGGRFIICLANVTLVDKPWKRKSHPIRFLRWGVRPMGFWGYGIAEQLMELQWEINWTLLTASEQMRLAGPKVFVERGSSINEDEINNEIWGIIEYSGAEPKYMMFQSVDPALFQHLDRCYARAFDEIGVSQMSAQGEKPAGLNSGKALMTYSDLETAKFVFFAQAYEQGIRQMSEDLLDTALESENPATATLIAPIRDKYRRRYLNKIKKSDIVASRDEFICQVFPTSALAMAPAQKMQQVGDMQDRGWLQPMEAMQLLDFPDLDNATRLATAPLEYIDMQIDSMLEDGKALRPEPWVDLQVAQQRVSQALMRAQIDEVPEQRWQLLAAYAKRCGDLIAKKNAAANQNQPMPGVPPQAAPPPQQMAA